MHDCGNLLLFSPGRFQQSINTDLLMGFQERNISCCWPNKYICATNSLSRCACGCWSPRWTSDVRSGWRKRSQLANKSFLGYSTLYNGRDEFQNICLFPSMTTCFKVTAVVLLECSHSLADRVMHFFNWNYLILPDIITTCGKSSRPELCSPSSGSVGGWTGGIAKQYRRAGWRQKPTSAVKLSKGNPTWLIYN